LDYHCGRWHTESAMPKRAGTHIPESEPEPEPAPQPAPIMEPQETMTHHPAQDNYAMEPGMDRMECMDGMDGMGRMDGMDGMDYHEPPPPPDSPDTYGSSPGAGGSLNMGRVTELGGVGLGLALHPAPGSSSLYQQMAYMQPPSMPSSAPHSSAPTPGPLALIPAPPNMGMHHPSLLGYSSHNRTQALAQGSMAIASGSGGSGSSLETALLTTTTTTTNATASMRPGPEDAGTSTGTTMGTSMSMGTDNGTLTALTSLTQSMMASYTALMGSYSELMRAQAESTKRAEIRAAEESRAARERERERERERALNERAMQVAAREWEEMQRKAEFAQSLVNGSRDEGTKEAARAFLVEFLKPAPGMGMRRGPGQGQGPGD
jgi:hypothetical protein